MNPGERLTGIRYYILPGANSCLYKAVYYFLLVMLKIGPRIIWQEKFDERILQKRRENNLVYSAFRISIKCK